MDEKYSLYFSLQSGNILHNKDTIYFRNLSKKIYLFQTQMLGPINHQDVTGGCVYLK